MWHLTCEDFHVIVFLRFVGFFTTPLTYIDLKYNHVKFSVKLNSYKDNQFGKAIQIDDVRFAEMANKEVTSSIRFAEENLQFQMEMMTEVLSQSFPYRFEIADVDTFAVYDEIEPIEIKKIVISSKIINNSKEYINYFKFIIFQYSTFINLLLPVKSIW